MQASSQAAVTQLRGVTEMTELAVCTWAHAVAPTMSQPGGMTADKGKTKPKNGTIREIAENYRHTWAV